VWPDDGGTCSSASGTVNSGKGGAATVFVQQWSSNYVLYFGLFSYHSLIKICIVFGLFIIQPNFIFKVSL
jgi:hypothetical protein